MDYKKIVKSRKLRIKILKLLDWIPDKTMIKLQYRIKTGRKLNLKNPKRFTEKLQWYKLYYKNPLMPQCVDKYDVREYVKSKGLDSILNELYGVYNKVEEIDFNKLPNIFVIKDTLGGGSNSVLVVSNKDELDIEETKKTISSWLMRKKKTKSSGREWPYENNNNRIIIEKYLSQKDGDLADYKFFCFNGKVEYFYKRSDYVKNHDDGKMSFYDKNKKWLKGVGMDYCNTSSKKQILPKNIDEMIDIAEKLSKDFPHVRVDLYNIDGEIIFGELTFYNASGYMIFTPDSFDYKISESWII